MELLELLKTRARIAANRGLSRSEFEHRRLKRFRRFAAFVNRESPYYARVMRERGINPAACVPEEFPVMTKAEVMSNFDEIVTARDVTRRGIEDFLHHSHDSAQLYRGRYRVIHTSGSSGQVGYFVYDEKSWARGIAQVSNTPSLGFLPRRRRLAFLGATDGHYAGVSMAGEARFAPFRMIYKARMFEVNEPLMKAVNGMNSLQPDVVIGYGSALAALAEKQLEGVLKIRPRMIANSGEPLPRSTQDILQEAFGTRGRNVYSCSEHLVIGVREAGDTSMRLVEDDLIIEMRNDCTLITNIFNTVMPLIRYRMNDILSAAESSDHSPYRSIDDVVGRVEQMASFVNRHGVMDGISPHTINELLIPHVWRFQMRITGGSSFSLAMVLDRAATPGDRERAIESAHARLRAILAQKEMENVEFSVIPVDDIPADSHTGKFRLIVDTLSRSAGGA